MSARQVVLAGASFVVAPVFRPAVVELCHRYDVAAMPGCFTPTEILAAWEAGADVVKVFPATALGPGYLRDLRGPLPQIRLMPTGGVTAENAGEWIRAGAVALGVGTALVDRRAVSEGRIEQIRENARRFVSAVQLAGVSSGPLRITEQPVQSAAETLRTAWLIGKFHGVKAATGPTGSRMTSCITPSARGGITRP